MNRKVFIRFFILWLLPFISAYALIYSSLRKIEDISEQNNNLGAKVDSLTQIIRQHASIIPPLINLVGKWTVCYTMSFSQNYSCNNKQIEYEFFANGTFKRPYGFIENGKGYPYSLGKWTLNESVLTMKEDDTKYTKYYKSVDLIKIISKDKFYKVGQEGPNGPTVYTFFEKVN